VGSQVEPETEFNWFIPVAILGLGGLLIKRIRG